MASQPRALTRADVDPTAATTRSRVWVRRWAWFGLAAQVAFVVGLLVAATWQGPRYSSLAHSISDM